MTCATRAADVYCHVTYLQVNHEDKDWFEETILQTIRSSFGGLPADMAQAERVCKELGERPRYFVDFMRPAEEDPETGEDLPRPRIYEVSSHDAPSRLPSREPSRLPVTPPVTRAVALAVAPPVALFVGHRYRPRPA